MNIPIVSGDIDEDGYKPKFIRVSFFISLIDDSLFILRNIFAV